MNTVIHAVYEKGVFRPLTPVTDLPEHATFMITIVPMPNPLIDPTSTRLAASFAGNLDFDDADVTPELLQELNKSIHSALSNVRDPAVMRQAAERMDRAREEMYKRTGLVDVVVPLLREIRDGE
jgi:hypothetical protein